MVGFSGPDAAGITGRAFLWSAKTGMRDIGILGGGFAHATRSIRPAAPCKLQRQNIPAHAFFFQIRYRPGSSVPADDGPRDSRRRRQQLRHRHQRQQPRRRLLHTRDCRVYRRSSLTARRCSTSALGAEQCRPQGRIRSRGSKRRGCLIRKAYLTDPRPPNQRISSRVRRQKITQQ
ncbi:MAG: hypothetical protein ACR2NX_13115 [Chthoniobacterales bacterium]